MWCNGKEENTASGSRFFKKYGCKGKQLTVFREITGCKDAFFFFFKYGLDISMFTAGTEGTSGRGNVENTGQGIL